MRALPAEHPMVQAALKSQDKLVQVTEIDREKKILTYITYRIVAWNEARYILREEHRFIKDTEFFQKVGLSWDTQVEILEEHGWEFPDYFPVMGWE